MSNLLNTDQVAESLGVSPRTMERWRYTGVGPAYIRVCGHVKYRQRAIEQWLDSMEVTHADA